MFDSVAKHWFANCVHKLCGKLCFWKLDLQSVNELQTLFLNSWLCGKLCQGWNLDLQTLNTDLQFANSVPELRTLMSYEIRVRVCVV